MLNECEMAEDVLVRHLDAKGSLGADTTHCVADVNRVNVSETLCADVHCNERTCNNNTPL